MRATDRELKAAEVALPPPGERPPPSVIAGEGDKAFAAVGMPYPEARCFLASLGYPRVNPTREPLSPAEGTPPYSVRVRTVGRGRKSSTVVGVATCRPLTEAERHLVALYHWLPAKVALDAFPHLDVSRREDFVAEEGLPYLCYAATRYDKSVRFGSYARFVLRDQYLKAYRARRRLMRSVKSLDRMYELVEFEPEQVVRASPHTTAEHAARLIAAYAPYADPAHREILLAAIGLDGQPGERARDIARRVGLSASRVGQIVSHVLLQGARHLRVDPDPARFVEEPDAPRP